MHATHIEFIEFTAVLVVVPHVSRDLRVQAKTSPWGRGGSSDYLTRKVKLCEDGRYWWVFGSLWVCLGMGVVGFDRDA